MQMIVLTPQLVDLIALHTDCCGECRGDEHAQTIWLAEQPNDRLDPITECELFDAVRDTFRHQYGAELLSYEAVEEIMPVFGPDDDRGLHVSTVHMIQSDIAAIEESPEMPEQARGLAFQSYRIRFRTDLPLAKVRASLLEAMGR